MIEIRKDFSKAERIDYARRLERIESLKAEKRKAATQFGGDTVRLNSDTPQRTDEVVARKLGIGGKDTYRKEKFIADNRSTLTPEDFADWDEGKLSTNKAYQKIKAELKRQNDIITRKDAAIAEKDATIADCEKNVSSLEQELDFHFSVSILELLILLALQNLICFFRRFSGIFFIFVDRWEFDGMAIEIASTAAHIIY